MLIMANGLLHSKMKKTMCFVFVALISICIVILSIKHTESNQSSLLVKSRGNSTFNRKLAVWHDITNATQHAQCDFLQLNINGTDVRNVAGCQFSNISLHPEIDSLLDSFQPEDIPKLPLLDNYRNPCWYEQIPANYLELYKGKGLIFEDKLQKSFERITPVYEKRMRQFECPWRLRCLPLVYIIGVEKCGTTDLFQTLLQHPSVVAPAAKEGSFWGINLWNPNQTFNDYVNIFDEAAESIRSTSVPRIIHGQIVEYHARVTVGSSIRTWFSSGGNMSNKKNKNRRGPEYLPAHPIRNLTPKSDLKIILLIREPIDRLFSSYVFFNTKVYISNISAQEFHDLSANHITVFNECMTSHTLATCLFTEQATPITKYVSLHRGIYYGYLIYWTKIFPDMRVIRMEDYKQNHTEVMNVLTDYLGLDQIDLSGDKKVINTGPKKAFEMLDTTRDMLKKFYTPFNKMLADFLKDERFLYN